MSRVLKGVVWKDDPHIVDAPKFERPVAVENAEPELDDETRENIMQNIRQKEERADQMVKDAQIASEIIKQEAKAEADKLLEEANQQIEQIKDEARNAGMEEGLELGRQEGMEQIKQEQHQIIVDANAKAENTIKIAQEEAMEYVTKAENTIAEMVMAIADKVIPQHFIDMPQLVLPLVQNAIEKVKDQPSVVIHVAPDVYELVLMAKTEFLSKMEGKAELTIVSDETLKVGDCVLESPNGTIDAKLSTQLEMIKQSIRDVMK